MSKFNNSSRIAKNTVLLYFRMLFLMGVSLYTSRIVLEVLGIEDYGIFNVVGGVVTLLAFLSGAMSAATQRFLSFELGKGDGGNVPRIFSAALSIHFIIGLIVVLIAETAGVWFFYDQLVIPVERIDAAFWVYQFAVLTFFVKIIQVPYNASLLASERMAPYAYISIVEVILLLVIVFLLKWIHYDKLILYGVLVFAITAIISLVYRIYCRRNIPFCRYTLFWDRPLYAEMVGYSSWSMFGSFSHVCKGQGVNILLNLFFGPAMNAARAVSFQVQAAMQSFVLNFQAAVKPQIIKLYASDEKTKMRELVFGSAKYSFFLLLMISLPVIIEIDYVLGLWLTVIPPFTSIFTILILSEILLDSFSGPLMTSVQATGRIRTYQIIIGGILLINLPVAYLFLKLNYEPYVVFYVSIAITLFAFVVRLILIKRMLDFSMTLFLKEVIFRALLVTIVPVAITLFIHHSMEMGILRLLLVIITTISFVLGGIYLFGMPQKERQFVMNRLSKITSKFWKNEDAS